MTVIEGLNAVPGVPKGSFAISLKLHHCVVDGMESVELMAAMHDLAPDVPRPAPPTRPFEPGPLPSTSDLVARTAINIALYPLRASKVLLPNAFNAIRHLHTLPGALASGVAATLAPGTGTLFPPATRFNGSATPHRVFEARFHDLATSNASKTACPGRRSTTWPSPTSAARSATTCRDATNCPTRISSRPARRPFGPLTSAVQAATDSSAGCTRWVPRSRPTRTAGGDRRRDRDIPRER